LLLPTAAFATCNPDETVAFTCTTGAHKRISLCEGKGTIVYAYGKEGLRPDIVLSVPRDQATTWQWPGIGRYENYSVDVANGKTIYRVFSSFDRLSEDHVSESGVQIEEGGKILATVNCVEASVTNNLQGIALSPTP
jgi:hypothetical protein